MIVFDEDQVDYFVKEENCLSYYIEDLSGCAKSNSYYSYFYDNFWDNDFLDFTQDYLENRDDDQLEEYHHDHRSDFVSGIRSNFS